MGAMPQTSNQGMGAMPEPSYMGASSQQAGTTADAGMSDSGVATQEPTLRRLFSLYRFRLQAPGL